MQEFGEGMVEVVPAEMFSKSSDFGDHVAVYLNDGDIQGSPPQSKTATLDQRRSSLKWRQSAAVGSDMKDVTSISARRAARRKARRWAISQPMGIENTAEFMSCSPGPRVLAMFLRETL